MSKYLLVSLTLLALASLINSHPMMRSPKLKRERTKREEGEWPTHEDEITFKEFESMHDYGNWTDTFKIFELSQKYFPNREKNISKTFFKNMCREYIIHDLLQSHFNLTFPTIAKLNKLVNHVIFRDHFTSIGVEEFSFKEMYYYTIGGRLIHNLVRDHYFEDLPEELKFKIKEMHADVPEYEFDMMFHLRGRKHRKAAELIDLKHKELQRKYKERYQGIEWSSDGRRVIDDDYDALEPAYKRNIHIYAKKQKDLKDEEIDMLLEEDL